MPATDLPVNRLSQLRSRQITPGESLPEPFMHMAMQLAFSDRVACT